MTPVQQIDNLIAGLKDWRGPMLARLRQIVLQTDPKITEDWKYMGSPCWYYQGKLIVAGNAFKTSLKLGFLYGASLPDPSKLFNTELEGNQRRGIKIFEKDGVNEQALTEPIKTALAYSHK